MLKLRNLLALTVVLSALMFWGCQNEQSSPVEPQNQLGISKLEIPAGATITSATVYFDVTRARNEEIFVHRITSDWDECSVTWNTEPSYNATAEGSFIAPVVGWYSVDVTAMVTGWVNGTYDNFGLLIKKVVPSDERDEIAAYEANPDLAAYVEVCWTLNGGSDCDTTRTTADTYVRQIQPDNNFCSDPTVNVGFEFATTLEKHGLFKFEVEQGQQQFDCETAYAFGDTPFCGLPDIGNWGWTELINGNYTNTNIPIYAGAAQCDPNNGTQVGTLSITYVGTSLTVNYTMNPGVTVDNVHMWIGSTPLPVKNGKLTSAPGQFNYNNQTFPFNLTKSNPFYIAVHFDVCIPVN